MEWFDCMRMSSISAVCEREEAGHGFLFPTNASDTKGKEYESLGMN